MTKNEKIVEELKAKAQAKHLDSSDLAHQLGMAFHEMLKTECEDNQMVSPNEICEAAIKFSSITVVSMIKSISDQTDKEDIAKNMDSFVADINDMMSAGMQMVSIHAASAVMKKILTEK